MPGVPSGRACAACRKQKKKCDEAQPTCARCKRLGVACVGAGERRYKFHIILAGDKGSFSSASPASTASTRLELPRSSSSEQSHESWAILSDRQPSVSRLDPSRSSSSVSSDSFVKIPSNRHTALVNAFSARVHFHPGFDLRYHLTWAFGAFLWEVPRHLGVNPALDATASALLLSHERYASGVKQPTRKELSAYSSALHALRVILDDAQMATTAETLCAVMLLMLCQYFIGNNGNRFSGHPEGAAKILKAKGLQYRPNDGFEKALLMTLRGPILFEGLYNPKIHLTAQEWRQLISDRVTANSDIEGLLEDLTHVPDIVARLRTLESGNRHAAPLDVHARVAASYASAGTVFAKYKTIYDTAKNSSDATHGRERLMVMSGHWQRQYSLALFNMVLFTYLFRCVCRDSKELSAELLAKAKDLSDDIIALTEEARPLRPLGNGFIIALSTVGWATAADAETKETMKTLWLEWAADSPGLEIEQLEWSSAALSLL